MRFLALLSPFQADTEFQRIARERFPGLVKESAFAYWSPEMPIRGAACRLLIGVAAGFSLPNLRILDLISDKIARSRFNIAIDVFDLDDCDSPEELCQYFTNSKFLLQPPIVGIWQYGTHDRNLSGHAATQFLIDTFDLGLTPEDLIDSVRPPTREMLGE
jgi:hypothetical protein